MPWRASRRCVRRVSSAAIKGTFRRVSRARRVTSPRFPIGVATTYSVPGRPPSPSDTGPALTDGPSLAGGSRPPPRIEVVDARRPRPELRDRRHLPLELGRGDHPVHALDHARLEPERDHLVDGAALVDPPEQQPI